MALATAPKTMVTMVRVELEAIDEAGTMVSYKSGERAKSKSVPIGSTKQC